MAELLTESFCERCGTRYTFESAAPRRRLRGIKTLGSGLRSFVLSTDVSLEEAMAGARSDAERESSAHQLDAFHKTFSFCMTCRQYTCGECWNGVEGRCLTCAPDPTRGALAASFDLPTAPVGLHADLQPSPVEPEPVFEPEPTIEPAWSHEATWAVDALVAADPPVAESVTDVVTDLALEPVAEDVVDEASASETTPEPSIEAGDDLLARIGGHAAVEASVAADSQPSSEADAQPSADAETPHDIAAHRASGRTSALLARFRPGQSLDDAIAAYEAGLGPDEASSSAPVAEAVEAVEAAEPAEPAEPEPSAIPAPEPLAADTAEPEAVAVEPAAIEPIAAATAPESPIADAAPQPVWQAPTPVAGPGPAPSWPTGPRWPTAVPARGAVPEPGPSADPLTALMARDATARMWAASSAELATAPPPAAATGPVVHECASCGLSLSATARFCRRCGTRQDG